MLPNFFPFSGQSTEANVPDLCFCVFLKDFGQQNQSSQKTKSSKLSVDIICSTAGTKCATVTPILKIYCNPVGSINNCALKVLLELIQYKPS